MNCYRAGNAIAAIALAMLAAAVIRIAAKDRGVKKGLSISLIPMSVITIIMPETLIALCLNPHMRCNTTMAPAVNIFSIIIIVFAILDAAAIKDRQ